MVKHVCRHITDRKMLGRHLDKCKRFQERSCDGGSRYFTHALVYCCGHFPGRGERFFKLMMHREHRPDRRNWRNWRNGGTGGRGIYCSCVWGDTWCSRDYKYNWSQQHVSMDRVEEQVPCCTGLTKQQPPPKKKKLTKPIVKGKNIVLGCHRNSFTYCTNRRVHTDGLRCPETLFHFPWTRKFSFFSL